jgi:MerR family transcriptional regulator, redox-sensitive transcriptional activator SoxR
VVALHRHRLPDRLDDAKRPGSRKESVAAREGAADGERKDESAIAPFQRVHHHHECDGHMRRKWSTRASLLASHLNQALRQPGGLRGKHWGQLSIGEVAERSGMTASRIRYYETRGLIRPPERSSGKRRYRPPVLRRLAIIDAAQRVGLSLGEISDLLGSRGGPAHERLRILALRKLPEIEALLLRASTVRQLLQYCGDCECCSIDESRLLDARTLQLDRQYESLDRRIGRRGARQT